MAEVKVTKKDYFEEIKAIAEGAEVENKEELIAFIDKQLETLANRAEKAKERAAEKKAAGDELRAVIETILKEATEPMTREMVLGCIEDPNGELTVAKVGSRITQLVKLDLVSKTSIKTEDGKSKTAYVYGTIESTDAE